jgi:2-oxoacid:acceptor oxidoreductase delta subunit (pyruvate/2-ketoisovalerate family)
VLHVQRNPPCLRRSGYAQAGPRLSPASPLGLSLGFFCNIEVKKAVDEERNPMVKACEEEPKKRVKKKSLPLKRRKKGADPIELGLSEEEAIHEARRCLGLRECESCDVCGLFCPDLCITRDEKTGEVMIDLDYCKGCGICAAVCPKGAIQMVLEGAE